MALAIVLEAFPDEASEKSSCMAANAYRGMIETREGKFRKPTATNRGKFRKIEEIIETYLVRLTRFSLATWVPALQ